MLFGLPKKGNFPMIDSTGNGAKATTGFGITDQISSTPNIRSGAARFDVGNVFINLAIRDLKDGAF